MRVSAVTTCALTILVVAMGCGTSGTSQAETGSSSLIDTLRSQIDDSQQSTYTAEYSFGEDSQATLANEADPRRAAYRFDSGLFVSTESETVICQGANHDDCQRSDAVAIEEPDSSTLDDLDGTGFVTGSVILNRFEEVSADRDTRVESSTKSVAGESSTCVSLSGGDATFGLFETCITDAGVLASFSGSVEDQRVSLEMTSFSDGIDEELFDVVD